MTEDFNVIVCGDGTNPQHDRNFPDNVHGPCEMCGHPLVWRPHSPPGIHVCMDCALALSKTIPEPEIMSTDESGEEFERVTGHKVEEAMAIAKAMFKRARGE